MQPIETDYANTDVGFGCQGPQRSYYKYLQRVKASYNNNSTNRKFQQRKKKLLKKPNRNSGVKKHKNKNEKFKRLTQQ